MNPKTGQRTKADLDTLDSSQADLVWLIYDLIHDPAQDFYTLTRIQTVYTLFEPALLRLTTAEPGPIDRFIKRLQTRLDKKLDETPPDAPTLIDFPLS